MNKRDSVKARKLLAGAYSITTAQDSIDYYRDFANIYDDEFAVSMDYVYPKMLSEVYCHYADQTNVPVADIGCGTGLVAEAIQATDEHAELAIDGIDISPEMLQAAKSKNLYRTLYCTDLSQELPANDTPYGAVVSAGTFTFGHLGPQTLRDLLALGKPNTLYCIGVNSAYFEEQGFNTVLTSMSESQLITEPVAEVRNIYKPSEQVAADNPHVNDTATVLVYRQI